MNLQWIEAAWPEIQKKKKIRGSTMILILSISDSNWAIKSKVSRGNHSESIRNKL